VNGMEDFKITILTPLHVGSGLRLQKNFDFITDRSKQITMLIDQEELLRKIVDNREAIEAFGQGDDFDFFQFIRNYHIPFEKIVARTYGSVCFTREIYEFQRNGRGTPYIPGTSLKGALRTVFLERFFSQLPLGEKQKLLNHTYNTDRQRQRAAEELVKTLLGGDPNHDLLRALLVGDAEFDSEDLQLAEAKILNLIDNGCGWKKTFRDRGTYRDSKQGTSIFVEALRPGAETIFSMKVDTFLFDASKTRGILGFEKKIFSFANLALMVNIYSKKQLIDEIRFLKNCGDNSLIYLISQIEKVEKQIPEQKSPNCTKQFVLRLSWGSGWKSMTGGYLDDEWLKKFRQKYKLGKRNFPIFPKTRKIAFENGTPKYLFGWVKIEKL